MRQTVKYYTTTLHADEEMLLDDISESHIKQVIENGEVDLTEKGDEIYIGVVNGRKIAVIIIDDERIRTVYPVF